MRSVLAFCLVAIVIFTSSCGYYTRQEKHQFYSVILATNDTLDHMTKEWHELLKKAIATNNYTNLSPYRIRLAQFLNTNRPKIANLEVTAGGESIRDSEEVFLSNQAIVIAEVYPQFESNNDLTPPDVVQGQLKTLGNDLENEAAINESIKQSLHSFARKNKMNMPQ